MREIYQMSPQLANLIAAGEVVERPGSVVKELVENAIDAGAAHVTVEIRRGGVSYLRVTDDGKGIFPEDVRTAFLRHATSKLLQEKDLMSIKTLGFRGEALAAIAAVSRVDLFTRVKGKDEGVQITIEGGEETGFGETGCPVGTTIVVRDLFFNVPARAKFLKKDATEAAYVENILAQVAISTPGVSFRLVKDGRECFSTPGDGDMRGAIYSCGGKDLVREMLFVMGGRDDLKVRGYFSRPGVTRATRSQQNCYVNGRFVRSRMLTAAVEEAYKGRLMTGRYPVFYMELMVSPTAVDVNVHPAKMEVKFSHEKEVFSAVYNCVVSALQESEQQESFKQSARVPREDHVTEEQQALSLTPELPKPEAPRKKREIRMESYTVPSGKSVFTFRETQKKTQAASPKALYQTGSQPSVPAEKPTHLVEPVLKELPRISEKPVCRPTEPVKAPDPEKREEKPEKKAEPENSVPAVRVLGELFHTYIIAEDREGVWLIDKHAAHEKMLYDQIKASMGDQPSQMLLTPLNVPMSAVEAEACTTHAALFRELGFELEEYGWEGIRVREAPMYLDEKDIPFAVNDIAGKLVSGKLRENELLDELLKSMACKAAVKAGMATTTEELQLFAQKVLADDTVRNCPHGRPCVTYLSRYQLEKMFKRVT